MPARRFAGLHCNQNHLLQRKLALDAQEMPRTEARPDRTSAVRGLRPAQSLLGRTLPSGRPLGNLVVDVDRDIHRLVVERNRLLIDYVFVDACVHVSERASL